MAMICTNNDDDPKGLAPDRIDAKGVINLGKLALAFARVNRVTYHEDGTTPESDTDHTVMLGVVACAFAARYLPELDLGRVAQYALVHDLVEVYAGDVSTLRITPDEREAKQARERAALDRMTREFKDWPWLWVTIDLYEHKAWPEARYVKALDKLLPKLTHILNDGVTLREQGMGWDELSARYDAQFHELQAYAADFPPLFELRMELVELVLAQMLP